MLTYRIHFIRHGLTEANFSGRYVGSTDLSLSPAGVESLKSVKTEGNLPYCEAVFSSPLKRCLESAEILFPGKTPITVDEFREYDFGEFENKTAYELEKLPEYAEWTSGRISAPPGGEDNREFAERLALGLNKTVRTMMDMGVRDAAVVVHGGVIMTLLAATALPRKQSVEWTCPAGNGFTARVTPSLYGKSGIIEIIDTVPSSMDFLPDDC